MTPPSARAARTAPTGILVAKLRRVRFRSFENYRLRLLLHRGVDWQTSSTTRSEAGYRMMA